MGDTTLLPSIPAGKEFQELSIGQLTNHLTEGFQEGLFGLSDAILMKKASDAFADVIKHPDVQDSLKKELENWEKNRDQYGIEPYIRTVATKPDASTHPMVAVITDAISQLTSLKKQYENTISEPGIHNVVVDARFQMIFGLQENGDVTLRMQKKVINPLVFKVEVQAKEGQSTVCFRNSKR